MVVTERLAATMKASLSRRDFRIAPPGKKISTFCSSSTPPFAAGLPTPRNCDGSHDQTKQVESCRESISVTSHSIDANSPRDFAELAKFGLRLFYVLETGEAVSLRSSSPLVSALTVHTSLKYCIDVIKVVRRQRGPMKAVYY